MGNAYDGVEGRAGTQPCINDNHLVLPGWECGGEAADYGDMLTSVQEANALSLWIAAASAEVMPPPPPPANACKDVVCGDGLDRTRQKGSRTYIP